MPKLIAFRNFHYKEGKNNPKRLQQLVAPPYDVISKEEELELKSKDPNNICNIILPDSYTEAGKKLNQMIADGTLMCEEDRCICIYGIDYKHPETGQEISRYGFVGLLKLVEIFPANDGVIPHEATFRKYTEDRLNLIRETDANFSPIFMIYNGNGSADKIIQKYIKREPHLQTQDRDNFTHKIWEIWKEKDIKAIQKIVQNNPVIIADGHHRYITTLRHSRHGGCQYIMALFIDFNDPGLIIFTSHRQVHKMPVASLFELKQKSKHYFKIEKINNYKELKFKLEEYQQKHVFGCYFQGEFVLLTLKGEIKPEEIIMANKPDEWKQLDLPILHKILFEKCLKINKEDISYIKDAIKGMENVNLKKVDALFIVNPTKLEDVHKITKLGEIMPQKSTYFYPKPLSGLVIHKHTDKIE
ncbi:MAG: hypothetical protein BAJALOKI1v1_810014 [Promethearchaeota archaeon]|nr:MAG: hypothetical protein BAJALOKI1v1_810014 [Candidatus Lokiarchaeota archaeon]